MKRVLIIGNSGGGKSTLARRLGARLGAGAIVVRLGSDREIAAFLAGA